MSRLMVTFYNCETPGYIGQHLCTDIMVCFATESESFPILPTM